MKRIDTSRLFDTDAFKRKHAEGRPVPLRKEFSSTISKAEGSTDESPLLDFILSTASADRSRDVISQDGWKLGPYQKNPVVLFGHNSWGLPVGKAPKVAVEQILGSSVLVSRATEFTPRDLNQMGWAVGQLCAKGFLNAVSVGFLPLKYLRNEERGGYAIDFVEQELLEFSVVPVPANPEALGLAKAAGIPIDWVPAWIEEARSKAVADGDFKSPELEYLERLRALGLSKKLFVVPGQKEDAPEPEDDEGDDAPLLEQMANLEAALTANTAAITAHTEALNKSLPTKAQTSAPAPVPKAPAVTATTIADEVRKQLATLTGSF